MVIRKLNLYLIQAISNQSKYDFNFHEAFTKHLFKLILF